MGLIDFDSKVIGGAQFNLQILNVGQGALAVDEAEVTGHSSFSADHLAP